MIQLYIYKIVLKILKGAKKKILKGLEIFSKPIFRWYGNAVTEQLKDVHEWMTEI